MLLDDPLISKSQTIGAPFFRVLLFYIWANNSNICRGETYVIEMLDTQQQQPSLKKETSDESWQQLHRTRSSRNDVIYLSPKRWWHIDNFQQQQELSGIYLNIRSVRGKKKKVNRICCIHALLLLPNEKNDHWKCRQQQTMMFRESEGYPIYFLHI